MAKIFEIPVHEPIKLKDVRILESLDEVDENVCWITLEVDVPKTPNGVLDAKDRITSLEATKKALTYASRYGSMPGFDNLGTATPVYGNQATETPNGDHVVKVAPGNNPMVDHEVQKSRPIKYRRRIKIRTRS